MRPEENDSRSKLVRHAAGHGTPVEELVKDTDDELREIENEIDRCQRRRRLLLALRHYLSELPEGALAASSRRLAWRQTRGAKGAWPPRV